MIISIPDIPKSTIKCALCFELLEINTDGRLRFELVSLPVDYALVVHPEHTRPEWIDSGLQPVVFDARPLSIIHSGNRD